MKSFKQMKADNKDKNYKEHRGILIRKYRTFFGKHIFVVDENGLQSKIYVGKCIFDDTELGTKLTIGELNQKLINIRPGFCKNTDQ
ncbi:MAG: hypothetical protein J6K88_05140 [Oscillospiraceae bacterium]|nr:hypothetical protein [Oscillospiraceae bacterium]